MPEPTTPPVDPAPVDPPNPDEEATYGVFKKMLDRYAEENKPAPEKTTKPNDKGIGNGLFKALGWNG